MEASYIGRAIITTDVPGCRDAVINNKTALIIPAKNSIKLSEAIERLIRDNELRNNLGINASIHAKKNFSLIKIVNQHIALYHLLSK